MHSYRVNVVRVVDGDTIIVDVDLGFEVWLKNIVLRLDRIDAYETRLSKTTTPQMKILGQAAKVWVKDELEKCADSIVIRTTKRGKYGRWIAEVIANDINIGDALVSQGFAVYKDY
jgi:micrococcal nuclease